MSKDKKKPEPTPLDQPSRRTVEQFLRDIKYGDPWEDAECRRLERELDDLQKRLLDVPEYKELSQRHDELVHKRRREASGRKDRVARVRQMYQTRGLTLKVMAEVQKLADEIAGTTE